MGSLTRPNLEKAGRFTQGAQSSSSARSNKFDILGISPARQRRLDRPTNTNTTESGGRRRTPYASRASGIAERLECARIPALLFEEGQGQSSDDDRSKSKISAQYQFLHLDTRHLDFIAKREKSWRDKSRRAGALRSVRRSFPHPS